METNLYIGNLPYETKEDDLRRLFTQFGTVNKITLINGRDTGSFKGFVFVTMSNLDEANKAIEQVSWRSDGSRELKVPIARPRASCPLGGNDSYRPAGYGSLSPRRGDGQDY